jgi:4-carboxymuconolactone decarboxylase
MHEGIAERPGPSGIGERVAMINATFAAGITSLEDVTRRDGALDARDKAMLLLAATAVRDREATGEAVERALALGNDGVGLQALALALYLSRGEGPCRAVLDAIDRLHAAPAGEPSAPPTDETITDMLAEFVAVFGELPERVGLLAQHSPRGLEAYHRMRTAVLRAGALDPLLAELSLMCVNAAEHRSDFAAVHAAGARNAGGTEEQLVEAGICAIPSGGVAAWLAASEAIISTRTREN